MASWLVYLIPAQVVCVQALARDMMSVHTVKNCDRGLENAA